MAGGVIMSNSVSNRYLLTVRFGKRRVHGLHIYNQDEAMTARDRLIAVGAKPSDIKIDTYESIFGGGVFESEVAQRAV
jgi:hypothetical protein